MYCFGKKFIFFHFSVIQRILRICVWSWHTYIICAYLLLLTFFVCKEQGCVNMKHKCSDSCWRCYCAVQPAYMCHAVWKQNNCILQNHSYLVRHCKTVCSREKKVQGVVFLEMATANLSWQDILNNLTEKAKKDGLIRSIKNAKTIEAKVDKVIDSISIRYFCT